MEQQTSSTTKSDPIIIEQAGMRMTVAHRQGLGGSDEGLTFEHMSISMAMTTRRKLRFNLWK